MLNPIINPRKTLVAMGTLLVACMSSNLYAAVGKVEFTTSGAYATNGGQQRTLAKGMEINQGDTIITEAGRTQIRFSDGGYISLQPNTEFKVDEYSYDGKTDGSEKGFFSLVKGGLRAITGAVGRVNKTAYRVNTPVATIGIRGTEFLAQFDGRLLVKVGDGAVYMTNASGDLILFKGQVGEVKDPNSKPNYTNDETTMNAGGPKGATPNQVNTENQQQQQQNNAFTVAEQYNEDGTSCVVVGNCPVVEAASSGKTVKLENNGVAYSGDFASGNRAGQSGTNGGVLGPAVIEVDGQGNIVAISDTTQPAPVTFTGTYLDKGMSGPVAWQRINNAQLTDGTNSATYQNIHLIYGPLSTTSDLGAAIGSSFGFLYYTYIGGTRPTDLAGNTGNVNSAYIQISQDGLYFIDTYVSLSINGLDYYGYGGTSLASLQPTFNTTGSAYQVQNSNFIGDFRTSIFFSGVGASHAGMSYVINNDITGAVALIQNNTPR